MGELRLYEHSLVFKNRIALISMWFSMASSTYAGTSSATRNVKNKDTSSTIAVKESFQLNLFFFICPYKDSSLVPIVRRTRVYIMGMLNFENFHVPY